MEQRLEAGIEVFRVSKIEEGLVSFIDLGHVNKAIISKMMPPVATFQIADRKIWKPALLGHCIDQTSPKVEARCPQCQRAIAAY